MQQICRALDACHCEGIIHRDLKPSNVMRDQSGKILVMDFGLAQSAQEGGLTRTGVLMGTLEYMSPEQAKGQPLDVTSDIYAAGLIFYELLTGRTAFHAESALASRMKRSQERAVPASTAEKTVPRAVSTSQAGAWNPTAGTVIRALRSCWRTSKRSSPWMQVLRPAHSGERRKLGSTEALTALLGVLLLFATVFLVQNKIWKAEATPHAPVTILVSDFSNETSDLVFDETLEPAFSVAMEGASFISSFNRVRAQKIAGALQPGAMQLNEQLARLVATREGISSVISGDIKREGDQYPVTVRAIDGVTGRVVTTDSERVAKQDVLMAMGKVAARIRKALGDNTPESVQLAAAETYTTWSLEAAHEYALAQVGQFSGNYNDAIDHSLKALSFDPELGRADVVLAVVYNNMKQPQQAEKYFKLALSKIDHMSEREKYKTRGARPSCGTGTGQGA